MKEPPTIAILSARLARAFPSLSTYSAAVLAAELEAVERAQRRHAERCCNGYRKLVPLKLPSKYQDPTCPKGMDWFEDSKAEERAGKRILRRLKDWQRRLKGLQNLVGKTGSEAMRCDMPDVPITLQHDPRGPVLLLKLPGEAEAVAV